MDYKAKIEVGDAILRFIVYVILLSVASAAWIIARGPVGVLIGHDVSSVSYLDMMLILAFLRLVYRCVAHAGSDEVPKRFK